MNSTKTKKTAGDCTPRLVDDSWCSAAAATFRRRITGACRLLRRMVRYFCLGTSLASEMTLRAHHTRCLISSVSSAAGLSSNVQSSPLTAAKIALHQHHNTLKTASDPAIRVQRAAVCIAALNRYMACCVSIHFSARVR